MAFVLQHRRRQSSLPMVKNWSECAGSEHETEEEVLAELEWWKAYDIYYNCTGWEYQIVPAKKRKK